MGLIFDFLPMKASIFSLIKLMQKGYGQLFHTSHQTFNAGGVAGNRITYYCLFRFSGSWQFNNKFPFVHIYLIKIHLIIRV